MKDSLFEMLMSFFEKSLSQLKDNATSKSNQDANEQEQSEDFGIETLESRTLTFKFPRETSMRIFTDDEKLKFTKPAYQFISKLLLWGIIAAETMELIINQLILSESRFVTLEETKWTIRNALADNLNSHQLAFLDLVLYQKEDRLPLH